MAEFSSNSKGNAALTTGIIGTALGGLLTLGNGAGLIGGSTVAGKQYVTKDELDYVQTIGSKDSEIALLKSEQNTEIKIADVYARLKADLNAYENQQNAVNMNQAVYNATANSAIAVLQNQVGVLNSLTKTVVNIGNVSPLPMPQYNSWTAPTTPTTT